MNRIPTTKIWINEQYVSKNGKQSPVFVYENGTIDVFKTITTAIDVLELTDAEIIAFEKYLENIDAIDPRVKKYREPEQEKTSSWDGFGTRLLINFIGGYQVGKRIFK
jgi:hypothetical protein